MQYSTGTHYHFLLNNRKTLINKLIQFSYHLKSDEERYARCCDQINRLNQCESSTYALMRYIEINRRESLSSEVWSKLERALIDEKYGASNRELQSWINVLYMVLAGFVLVVGALITLCVLINPVSAAAFMLVGPALFFLMAIISANDHDLRDDNVQIDYAVGLAFAPEELTAKLSKDKVLISGFIDHTLFGGGSSAEMPFQSPLPLATAVVVCVGD